jgi:hypothetical protein
VTLRLRNYQDGDAPQIYSMHASQGYDFKLPPLDDPSLMVNAVLEGHSGNLEMAVVLQKTAEVFLLMDPFVGSKKEKVGKILLMQKALMREAQKHKLKQVHCWLAPDIAENFGKLLLHLGWKKPLWASYFREIE